MLFGHMIGCYGNSIINRNYFWQSFTMAKLEAFRTYSSQDRPPPLSYTLNNNSPTP